MEVIRAVSSPQTKAPAPSELNIEIKAGIKDVLAEQPVL
jgi:hypothetical protein